VPAHDILLASPCCQGHAKARGKKSGNPEHNASRSTAWAPVLALEFHRPQAAVIEHVPEFTDWVLHPAWLQAVQVLVQPKSEIKPTERPSCLGVNHDQPLCPPTCCPACHYLLLVYRVATHKEVLKARLEEFLATTNPERQFCRPDRR
jgi:hypothetical protein